MGQESKVSVVKGYMPKPGATLVAAVLCGSQECVESLQPTVPTECLVSSILMATQVCEGPPDANSHPHPPVFLASGLPR